MAGKKTQRKGGGSDMKLTHRLSPWARQPLSCRKQWCLSPCEAFFPGTNMCSQSPQHCVFHISQVILVWPHRAGMFSGSLLESVVVYTGFHTPMGLGTDPAMSLVDPPSGTWGKEAVLPWGLQRFVTWGAVHCSGREDALVQSSDLM